MFTRQAPAIHTALWMGGVSPAMASQVQNLLGQCRAQLVHRGPISVDYTSPAMRLIDPDAARTRFPEVEDIGQEPDERPKGEDDPPPPPPNIDPPPPFRPPDFFPPPDPPGGGQNLGPGDYIEIKNQDIHLRHKDSTRGALGRNCTFQQGDVRGVIYETKNINDLLAGEQLPNGHIQLQWDEAQADKTVLEYGLKDLKKIRVVNEVSFYPEGTPVEYGGDGKPGILVQYKFILAWEAAGDYGVVIPLTECEEDGGGGSGYPRAPGAEAENVPSGAE